MKLKNILLLGLVSIVSACAFPQNNVGQTPTDTTKNITTISNVNVLKCEQEGSIMAMDGQDVSVTIKNNARKGLKVYVLGKDGKRMKAVGVGETESYIQKTFTNYPILLTGDDDKCLGIFVPNATTNVSLEQVSY